MGLIHVLGTTVVKSLALYVHRFLHTIFTVVLSDFLHNFTRLTNNLALIEILDLVFGVSFSQSFEVFLHQLQLLVVLLSFFDILHQEEVNEDFLVKLEHAVVFDLLVGLKVKLDAIQLKVKDVWWPTDPHFGRLVLSIL